MKIKSIQTIGKASYNLCSMVVATAAVSAVSIFGTVVKHKRIPQNQRLPLFALRLCQGQSQRKSPFQ
ncbi:hypothetical protein [Hydrocoleum sp. CS-953]|uniref:hypothetical protein n=1 Tax=Hydrocoleum sp. CS-953 TaxID=1671698 RepID=UPI00117B76D8|nr:hypothetical protein [Hydrocoleum sp. CS-953]